MKNEEVKKFHDLTRPPKHRWLKVIKQSLADLTSVIKYHWYNILYKLQIIKRFNRRDETSRRVPFAPRPCPFTVDGTVFRALAVPTVIEYREIEEDYFYTDQKGAKKVLYVMKQEEHIHTVMHCGLQDPALKIGGKMYKSQLPQIRIMHRGSSLPFRPPENGMIFRPKYDTMTYDLQKVTSIQVNQVVSNDPSPEELKYTYDHCVQELNQFSRRLTLKDLEV